MEHRRAILAVKPHLALALVTGEKRFEFRRVHPAFRTGDIIYVYATAPVQAIVGSFTCDRIIEGTPRELWQACEGASEPTRSFLRNYFDGRAKGYAIQVRDPRARTSPLTLDILRELIPGFHPPRSYRFLADGLDLECALT
jgi:predicted transcriptional regulator